MKVTFAPLVLKGLLVCGSLLAFCACQGKTVSAPQKGQLDPDELAAIQDTCVSFNPETLRVLMVAGRWQIVADNKGLLDFGNRQTEAHESRKIIQRHELNQACRFDQSSQGFQYFLSSGKAPTSLEKCMAFNVNRLSVRKQSTKWAVVEKGVPRIHLAEDKEQAKKIQGILMKHQFTTKCTIGEAHPSFQYFRR